jgi:hypothetical protein
MANRDARTIALALLLVGVEGCGGQGQGSAQGGAGAPGAGPAQASDPTQWSYRDLPTGTGGRPGHVACITSVDTVTVPDDSGANTAAQTNLCVTRQADGGQRVEITTSAGAFDCQDPDGCTITMTYDGGDPRHVWMKGPHDNVRLLVAYLPGGVTPRIIGAKDLHVEASYRVVGPQDSEFNIAGLDLRRIELARPNGPIPPAGFGGADDADQASTAAAGEPGGSGAPAAQSTGANTF